MTREATLRVYRGDRNGGEMVDYQVPVSPGMVILDAIRSIYGVDFGDMSLSEAVAFYDNRSCVLERGYLGHGWDSVLEVMRLFPALTHVVAIQPGATPLLWSCGAFEGEPLDLPVSYENQTYIVYDVTAENAAR